MTINTNSRLEPVGITAATIDDEFWTPRIETVRETTINFVYERLVESGRIENFRVAAGADGEYQGRFYNDSDVYKWLEGACYALSKTDDPNLEARIEEVVSVISNAQEPDGYLNSYFQTVEPDMKWTNLHFLHELYCAGHLIEAAIAHHEVTGKEKLLTVATDFADHIDDRFGADGRDGVPGHQEIELALVKLYRVTDEERYLDLARYFIDRRGAEDSRLRYETENPDEIAGEVFDHLLDETGEYDGRYCQDHAPLREQQMVEGHAVRAMYLYIGAADVAAETGDSELVEVLTKLWKNMTTKRMYVTGGIGSSYDGERFTEDYDLPNATSYAETCAALGSILWNQRLLHLTREARFGDVQSRTLYNALLAGLSLDGTRFFYANPHEMGRDGHPLHDHDPNRFATQRQGWFETACCPTNVPRLLLSLGSQVYAFDDTSLYVNHHIGSEATVEVSGTSVDIDLETSFPWEAKTTVTVDPREESTFELALRVPSWCENVSVSVAGEFVDAEPGEYVRIEREWTSGDTVVFDAAFPTQFLAGHPSVEATAGAVAIQRGPIVYCVEGRDSPRPLHQLRIKPDDGTAVEHDDDLFGGVNLLELTATVPDMSSWDDGALYKPSSDMQTESAGVRAIPYSLWANRGETEMRVWLDMNTE